MDIATTLAFWTATLNLSDFRVVHLDQASPDEPFRFTLVPVQEFGCCPHCGHATEAVQRRHRSGPIKDLPVGDRPVELFLSVPQYECRRCQRYFTPHYRGMVPGTHATERFLTHIARVIHFSDIANVAALHGIPERTLAKWFYDHLDRRHQSPTAEPHRPIVSIGIDELSLKKSTGNSSP